MNLTIIGEAYNNKKLIPNLYKLLEPLISMRINKEEMVKEIERIEGKPLSFDFAIPLQFQNHLNDLEIDSTFFIWDYSDSIGGKPLNLLERYFKAFMKEIEGK